MLGLALTAIAVAWSSLSIYFAWRWFLHRRTPSLLCAVMPLGWVAYTLSAPADPFAVFAALALGLWGVIVVVVHEANQPAPFR